MGEMISKSTAIVRARVTGTRTAANGPMIYTFSRLQVIERWKGSPESSVEVATPGGKVNGLEQYFSGTPKLVEGSEYLFFLWTGKNKITQVMGLSQGVFDLKLNQKGDLVATHAGSTELMLDPATKQRVTTQDFTMRLQDLGRKITSALASGEVR